jgi:hypothetical protein
MHADEERQLAAGLFNHLCMLLDPRARAESAVIIDADDRTILEGDLADWPK